ncbi:MAG TPA: DNA double-strand break repair nuclease NurA [Blastocatellia bacterium]|nr:DNA double-strand break repair nuclease NurA [Blastocatellia bacterium]
MTQPGLPFFNPRDRGRLNAVRNLLASVSDELRRQADVVQGIVEFTTQGLPDLLKGFSPFALTSADHLNPSSLSRLPFQINDFSRNSSTRPAVFSSTTELLQNIDVQKLASALQGVELIGIDESKVDAPLPYSSMAFLRSIAFRMYRTPNGEQDEAVGPLLSELRLRLRDSEGFELENQLLGYLRNTYIAYISSLTAITAGRKPFVVLHGPLVRAIGGFSQLSFDYETTKSLLNVIVGESGEFDLPQGASKEAISGDSQTENNLPLSIAKAIRGEENIKKFNEFCLFTCGRKCDGVFPDESVPPKAQKVSEAMMKKRRYPGFCLYFWLLRSLFDLQRLGKFNLISAVENISASTEFTRLTLPSLIAHPKALHKVVNSSLKAALKKADIHYPDQPHQRRDLYKEVQNSIDRLSLTDSNIFSFTLGEGQYTSPVEIYRYRPKRLVQNLLRQDLGIDKEFEPMLETLFPFSSGPSRPEYKVLMSYVRTSPLREPVRFEFFDMPHITDSAEILGPAYLLSVPYQEYGIPIILYYADKLAHTPMQLVRTIIEREYLDLVLQNKFTDPVSIMQILGKLSRGYFQREGLR